MSGMDSVRTLLTQQYLAHVTNCYTCTPLCDTAIALRVCMHRIWRCANNST